VRLRVELDQEEDGRWIAEVVDLPGVLAYGHGPELALQAGRALALQVLHDRIEHGELDSQAGRVELVLAGPCLGPSLGVVHQ
jgi:predicted RNase H-like HicB family nuclease